MLQSFPSFKNGDFATFRKHAVFYNDRCSDTIKTFIKLATMNEEDERKRDRLILFLKLIQYIAYALYIESFTLFIRKTTNASTSN